MAKIKRFKQFKITKYSTVWKHFFKWNIFKVSTILIPNQFQIINKFTSRVISLILQTLMKSSVKDFETSLQCPKLFESMVVVLECYDTLQKSLWTFLTEWLISINVSTMNTFWSLFKSAIFKCSRRKIIITNMKKFQSQKISKCFFIKCRKPHQNAMNIFRVINVWNIHTKAGPPCTMFCTMIFL